ncbi:MAG TPA: hypothetical protein V6D33_12510 [Cyanophyceae cyanobacterium]
MISTDKSKYDKNKPFRVAQRIRLEDGQILTPGEEYEGENLEKLPDRVFEQSLVIQEDEGKDKVVTVSTTTPPPIKTTLDPKPNP